AGAVAVRRLAHRPGDLRAGPSVRVVSGESQFPAVTHGVYARGHRRLRPQRGGERACPLRVSRQTRPLVPVYHQPDGLAHRAGANHLFARHAAPPDRLAPGFDFGLPDLYAADCRLALLGSVLDGAQRTRRSGLCRRPGPIRNVFSRRPAARAPRHRGVGHLVVYLLV
ncbi:MAG: hypothetical protein AVDCRST_MAG86-2178, partial [uncultured Truepera sp.]